ncbi:MAG: transposase [Candidatus Omnitrophica bacterium]|nr:transposase [Candidatus Omnitrophota bacterium]
MEDTALVLEKEEAIATPGSAAKLIRDVKRPTRKKFFVEDKIRIVLEGFRKEIPVSDLCRRENISTAIYYSWLKDFMEAGKACLKGNSLRNATKGEVKQLREENSRLKELLGEQALQMQLLKKSLNP